MDQYIGKFLDNRYELLEVIGTGGMAVVYKARCHRLNRLVAVKILRTDLAQDAEFRRRFHDESQAVAMLSHPNIVAVYDVSHSDDLDYIVMELIDGITLKQYMQKKGAPLNWREALHFITQIVRALSHAHSRGIIHRDIKPHNIMVLRDGSVKVSDFGIARITSAQQSTLTQEALGSVHYISPEQARGSHIDARSDIYSAGVVLYEMITGRLPFEGETPVAVAIQHINSIPLSPRELNPDIPEALEAITMKAMAPAVDERYLNADAMLADLEEFRKNPNINFEYTVADFGLEGVGDEPTRTVPIHQSEPREERPARRDSQEERRARRRREEYEDDYEDDRRGPIWPILLAVGAIVIFIIGVVWFLWSNFFSGIVTPQDSQTYEIPDLRGKTLAEIYADREVLSTFTIKEGEVVYSEEYAAGEVASQDPEPGEHVKEVDLTITVDISMGSDELTIPDVENMERRTALDLLRDKMGLIVEEQSEFNDEITKGYAIRTDLPVNTPVKRGDDVTLVISDGPEPVLVTPFVGMPLEDAKRQIEKLDLVVGEVEPEPSEEYEEGIVTWQSVDVGDEVPPKTVVNLRVSAGSASPSPSESPSGSPDESPSAGPSTSAPPDVSTQPSPPPAESQTPPPVTAPPSEPPSGMAQIYISLPQEFADKSAVQVRIEVDGVVKRNETALTASFPLEPQITGRGTQEVKVYIDDTLVMQFSQTFS